MYTTGFGWLRAIAWVSLAWCWPGMAFAERPASNVPPRLEIEVLDPGVDPNGDPAVRLETQPDGRLAVDIPPVVLVHRYYYSGDRAFQGPMLPGGPSILVVNHPRSGERCYIEAQMLPGAPRVTYTKSAIEYDYGENAVTLHFGLLGKPSLKYRNGTPWSRKIQRALHTEELHKYTEELLDRTKSKTQHATRAVKGAIVEVGDFATTATLPVRNTMELLPFGKAVFSSDVVTRLEQRAAEHDRDKGKKRLEQEKQLDDATFRTVR